MSTLNELAYPTFQAPKSGPAPTYQAPDAGPNEYDQAFQRSMEDARSSVQAQLRNALAEVDRHEGVASQMIGQLPGQYNSLYDLAGNQINQMGQAADAATGKVGMGTGTPASAALSPILATMAQQRATSQAGVPLLQLGNADMAQQQRGAANQAGQAAQSQLGQEERGNLQQLSQSSRQQALQNAQLSYQSALSQYDNDQQKAMEVAKAQYDAQLGQYNAAQQERQRQQDYQHQTEAREQDFRNQVSLQALAASNKNNPAMLGPFGADEVSAVRGASFAGADAERLTHDSAYTKLRAELMKKPPKDDADLAKRVADFQKKNKKANAAALSLALFNLYGMPAAAKSSS